MGIDTREAAKARIEDLVQASWALTALSVATERRLLEPLASGVSAARAAQLAGVREDVVAAALDVLCSVGLLTRTGESYVSSPGFADLVQGGGAGMLGADLRSTLSTQQHVVATGREPGRAIGGWPAHDPVAVEAQGIASYELTRGMASNFLPTLPDLPDRLRSADSRMLDVGAGAAGGCIAICEQFSSCRVVGIEPSPSAMAIARRNVERAGLSHRIELRQCGGESLDEVEAYDLVYVAQMFIPDEVIDDVLRAAVRSMRDGAYLITAAVCGPGEGLPASIGRFRACAWGGGVRFADDVIERLKAAGLSFAMAGPTPPGAGELRPILGRRMRRN
jgi:SAM-dependent methyltransferase